MPMFLMQTNSSNSKFLSLVSNVFITMALFSSRLYIHLLFSYGLVFFSHCVKLQGKRVIVCTLKLCCSCCHEFSVGMKPGAKRCEWCYSSQAQLLQKHSVHPCVHSPLVAKLDYENKSEMK